MTRGIAAVIGAALVLIVVMVVVLSSVVLPRRSVDLESFADEVGSPGGATSPYTNRSIVGSLVYAVAEVTDGRVDDFWARTGDGEAFASMVLRPGDGRTQDVSVDVIDLGSGQRGLAPCRASRRCTVTVLPDGASLAVLERLYGTGVNAVLTDPADSLHVDVQVSGSILTADQVARIASAPWWSTQAPRSVATASRWLKVQQVETSFTD